jgi:glycosyltransferase involved in cell wall biosynthesis
MTKIADVCRRFAKVNSLVDAILDWKPDLVYRRMCPYYPAVQRLQRQVPTILEVNTNVLPEAQVRLRAHMYWYGRLTGHRLLKTAAGMVFISLELSQKPYYARHRRPYLVLGNAIDLGKYAPIPAPNNPHPRLVFIGSRRCPWHGMAKIVALARAFSQWHFDIIGYGPDDIQGNVPSNIKLHGYLQRSEYEMTMARADVALGTLALHVNGMDEGSPLKVREYLAYGIPTLIGYHDTDFPAANPYILELPSTANNIEAHMSDIATFVERVRGSRIPREAVAHLDVKLKEPKRLRFFHNIAFPSSRTGDLSANESRVLPVSTTV